MKPPIPSPAARDCPRCGASIEDARLSIGTIISATFLGILCLPMGACSLVFGFSAITTPDHIGMNSFILVVSSFGLLLAALGIWGMIKMLRKK
jgi:hypothetical protein